MSVSPRLLTKRRAAATLLLAALATGGLAVAATGIETEVDFVDTVPDHAGLAPYRALLQELDGVRFIAIYHAHDAATGTDHLRGEAFDALVAEQVRLSSDLRTTFPGAFGHELTVAEAMRQGNYMLEKLATGGNPRPDAYAIPSDPVRYEAVKQQLLGDDTLDDVLARDGSSAIGLWFVTNRDAAAGRDLAAAVGTWLADWRAADWRHPVTSDHQVTGLLWASATTDAINRDETATWGAVAAVAVAVSLVWVLRRPANAAIAVTTLAAALTWTYGTMALLGIRVSFLTAFLAPVVIGIGIDYAVHLLHRYDEHRRRGEPAAAALHAATAATRPAIALTAITTAAGLAVLLLVPAPLFAEIGGVAALGIIMAWLATLTVTPALRRLVPGRRRVAAAPAHRRDAWWTRFGDLPPRGVFVVIALVTVAAIATAATGTRIESGSAENEFPQDDPVIQLQHRIEAEYGAFQRAYLVVQGPIDRADALAALHAVANDTRDVPLWREATSVAELVLADRGTDQGAADVGLAALLTPAGQASPTAGLPTTDDEARAALDALFADPLWRTLAPFTVSRDYDLAVVAITIDPWANQTELDGLAAALRGHAGALQRVLDDEYAVAAAGSPLNRASIVHQTPIDVATATLGTTAVVVAALAIAWRRRPRGLVVAGAAAGTVLVAAMWLLAAIPALDALYAWGATEWGWPANNAALNNMFLLAFAITVAAGIDDWVHFAHRAWDERDVDAALRTTGRALTGTTLTTTVAFAAMAGIYFLQSKNLAILTALGVMFAYLLTMSLGPIVMRGAVGVGGRQD